MDAYDEQQHLVSLIISPNVSDVWAEMGAKYFFPRVKKTLSIPEWNIKEDVKGNLEVMVLPSLPKQSSITTLNVTVCKHEIPFWKMCDEVNFLYQRCKSLPEAALPNEYIIPGNAAIAWDMTTNEFRRVEILSSFTSPETEIRCKILDYVSDDVSLLPKFLFGLVQQYAKFPPRIVQVQLEHLRHYESCVFLKRDLEKKLQSPSEKFTLEFIGRCNENGIPLVYLWSQKSMAMTINHVLLGNIFALYDKKNAKPRVKKNDVFSGVNVTNVLVDGYFYFQNQENPMYKHLMALLSLVPSKYDSLIPLQVENISLEQYYVTKKTDGKDTVWCRVQILPPADPTSTVDYSDGACVEYSDFGGRPYKPIHLSELYLAADVDPVLGNLPQQCLEAKLMEISKIPSHLLFHQVKSLLGWPDCNNLFTVVVGDVTREDSEVTLHVELFREPDSKRKIPLFSALSYKYSKKTDITVKDEGLNNVDKNKTKTETTKINKKQAELVPYFNVTENGLKKKSVNVEILKIIKSDESNPELPERFTTLKTRVPVSMLSINFNNRKYKKDTTLKVILESVYSYEDFTIISVDDLNKRNEIEKSLLEHTFIPEKNWTKVDEDFLDIHPDFMYCVPKKDDPSVKCRAAFLNKIKIEANTPEPGAKAVSYADMANLYLLDYGLKQATVVSEMEILPMKKYYAYRPLGVCARTRQGHKIGKTIDEFKSMVGQTIKIKIFSVSKDKFNRTWVTVSIVKKKKTLKELEEEKRLKSLKNEDSDSSSSEDQPKSEVRVPDKLSKLRSCSALCAS